MNDWKIRQEAKNLGPDLYRTICHTDNITYKIFWGLFLAQNQMKMQLAHFRREVRKVY